MSYIPCDAISQFGKLCDRGADHPGQHSHRYGYQGDGAANYWWTRQDDRFQSDMPADTGDLYESYGGEEILHTTRTA